MTKYFDNPDSSLEFSFQGPLKELDLNESTDSFLEISPKKSSKPDRTYTNFRKSNAKSYRNVDNKENTTDVEKLSVIHRGPHGEQAGTLIVRHYVQKESKCVQCRNCGIFFTVNSFLKHCHDQYGKRTNCNSLQLQLALDNPTSQQKDVWNGFQKKLLNDKGDLTILRPDSSAARHIQNLDLPSEKFSSRERQRRIRRSSVEMPLSRRVGDISGPDSDFQPRRNEGNLYRSRKFPSSSAINANTDSLSLSELRPERRSNRMSSSYGAPFERDTRRPLYVAGRIASYDNALPDRIQPRSRQYEYQTSMQDPRPETYPPHSYGLGASSAPRIWDTSEFREKSPFPSPRPVLPMYPPTENSRKPMEEIVSNPIRSIHEPMDDLNILTKENETDEDPKDLISKATSLLQLASNRISRDKGQNSNAWRKMYEEERDHRMQLEAKIRDLERELRSGKT